MTVLMVPPFSGDCLCHGGDHRWLQWQICPAQAVAGEQCVCLSHAREGCCCQPGEVRADDELFLATKSCPGITIDKIVIFTVRDLLTYMNF